MAKLDQQRAEYFKATENLRQDLYAKQLELRSELAKENPDTSKVSKLQSDISWVTLATSITLTPGTITMDIQDGEFFVHALDEVLADDLDAGEMEDRIAHMYMEADHIYVQDVLDVSPIFGELRKGM